MVKRKQKRKNGKSREKLKRILLSRILRLQNKKRDAKGHLPICSVYIPTLALSKSGCGSRRYSLLSAGSSQLPVMVLSFLINNSILLCAVIFKPIIEVFFWYACLECDNINYIYQDAWGRRKQRNECEDSEFPEAFKIKYLQ